MVRCPEPVTLDRLRLAVNPTDVEAVKPMPPEKPLRLLTVTLAAPVAPASMVNVAGLAAKTKSTIRTMIGLVVWESDPLEALTVTV